MKPTAILVIDDDPYIRKMVRILLESQNYQVIEAEDGRRSLMAMEKQLPQLVVQDLSLPDMDTFDLNRKLLAYNKDIPIIGLTGVSTTLMKKADYSGFRSFLLKPIEADKFISTIKSHLDKY